MKALVLGAGGFIGNHMVSRLKMEGYFVRGIDLKLPEFSVSEADEFIIGNLLDAELITQSLNAYESFDEIYQFAADMGGAGYVFSGNHDSEIMTNSVSINLNLLRSLNSRNLLLNENYTKVFYSSSACIYPIENQINEWDPNCEESTAYPANPDSEYGWEKLFSERLYSAYNRNYKIPVAVARYHNIYGPLGTWDGGKEKAPAAICRKIAKIPESKGEIEIWGDGLQTRSFLYIDDCIEASRKLMKSNFEKPINIGSEEMISINDLVKIVSIIASKDIAIRYNKSAPVGVRGRNSHNNLIKKQLNWQNSVTLEEGISLTYDWIAKQIL